MFRSPLSRRLAFALAWPAACALSVSAMAHGVAHQRLTASTAHAGGHDGGHTDEGSIAGHHGATTPEEGTPGPNGRDHAHPDIDTALAAKGTANVVGMVPVARFELPIPGVASVEGARGYPVQPRVSAHGAHAPPPSLRSPPNATS